MINIIIVDDQDLMVQGLSMILSKEEGINVVGVASNGIEAVNLCKTHDVHVVLLDIRMPIMDGVEATKKIKEVNENIKVIILTTFNDDEFIFSSLKNGASGYLLKDALPSDIINAIKKVFNGGTLINPYVATKVVDKLTKSVDKPIKEDIRVNDLTDRELDICRLLGEGKNNKEIGEILYISEGTVKNNISRILSKLELRDRTQLALFSVKNNL